MNTPKSHPGLYLRAIMYDKGYELNDFAKITCIPQATLKEIIEGKKDIDHYMSLKISMYLGTPAEFWEKLQIEYNKAQKRERITVKEVEKDKNPPQL